MNDDALKDDCNRVAPKLERPPPGVSMEEHLLSLSEKELAGLGFRVVGTALEDAPQNLWGGSTIRVRQKVRDPANE